MAIFAVLYVGSFDKRRRSEDDIKQHKITLLEERDRIIRFIHKFKENSEAIGNLVEEIHRHISDNPLKKTKNIPLDPKFLQLMKYPHKCNYDQYRSINLQNESLIENFDNTITTITEHDNRVEYIVRLIKSISEDIDHLKYIKEQCELFMDDITLYQKNYKNLSDTIKKHIDATIKINDKKILKIIPRSSRWKIKKIRSIEIIKPSEPSK